MDDRNKNSVSSVPYRYLQFFRTYQQIVGTLSPKLQEFLLSDHMPEKVGTPSPQLAVPADRLVVQLSYSHLELLVDVDDGLKRKEIEQFLEEKLKEAGGLNE